MLGTGCALVRPGPRDGTFTVAGVVTDQSGSPVPDAEVVVRTSAPLLEAPSPVDTLRATTTEQGTFGISSPARDASVAYILLVRKDGYEPYVTGGVSPTESEHRIRLRRLHPPAAEPTGRQSGTPEPSGQAVQ